MEFVEEMEICRWSEMHYDLCYSCGTLFKLPRKISDAYHAFNNWTERSAPAIILQTASSPGELSSVYPAVVDIFKTMIV